MWNEFLSLFQDISLLVSILIAVLLALISNFFVDKILTMKREKLMEQRKKIGQKLAISAAEIDEIISYAIPELPEQTLKRYIQYPIYSQRVDGSFPEPPIVITSSVSDEEIDKKIEERTLSISSKIEEIEQRFPSESTLEKISSVNDAILGTSIENLSESIRRLEDKLLTKWDVAKIVFQILAAMGSLIVLVLAIIKFIVEKS